MVLTPSSAVVLRAGEQRLCWASISASGTITPSKRKCLTSVGSGHLVPAVACMWHSVHPLQKWDAPTPALALYLLTFTFPLFSASCFDLFFLWY